MRSSPLLFVAIIFLIYQIKLTHQEEVNVTGRHVCRLPKIVGSCKLKQKRFYFDGNINECVEFYYEGCAGNKNNFKTKEICEITCLSEGSSSSSF